MTTLQQVYEQAKQRIADKIADIRDEALVAVWELAGSLKDENKLLRKEVDERIKEMAEYVFQHDVSASRAAPPVHHQAQEASFVLERFMLQ